MLEVVGHPFAVNPDRPLAKAAAEHGWESMTFSKPVKIRDRMTLRTPIVGGGLALAGAVALAVLRSSRRLHGGGTSTMRTPA